MSNLRPALSSSFILSLICLLWTSISTASPNSIVEQCVSKWGDSPYDNVKITRMYANGDHGVCGSCWFTVNDDNADDGDSGGGDGDDGNSGGDDDDDEGGADDP